MVDNRASAINFVRKVMSNTCAFDKYVSRAVLFLFASPLETVKSVATFLNKVSIHPLQMFNLSVIRQPCIYDED